MDQNTQSYPMMQQSQMPPNTGAQPMQMQDLPERKKSKGWIWLLIILILAGAAAYYFFFM
jgi:Mg2+ and Co2+ transporter CorA